MSVLLALAPAALAALPSGGAHYAGKTSEDLGVTLQVARDGHYVGRMRIHYHVKCADGARGAPSTTLFDLHLNRHGRFGFKGTYTGRVDDSKNHVTLRGRVSAHRASGTFKLTAKREKVRCNSARVRWHARVGS